MPVSSSTPKASYSAKLRDEGNKLYKSVTPDLAPVLRKSRLEQAICSYNKALYAAANDDERASAAKNVGVASAKLANLFHSTGEKLASVKFRFKQAIEYFSRSCNYAAVCKDVEWQGVLLQAIYRCIEDALQSFEGLVFQEKMASFEELVYAIESKRIRAEFCLQIGEKYFHESIVLLAEGDFKKCLHYLHECYRPVEEADRAGRDLEDVMTEVNILRKDITFQSYSAESAQARSIGNSHMLHISCYSFRQTNSYLSIRTQSFKAI